MTPSAQTSEGADGYCTPGCSTHSPPLPSPSPSRSPLASFTSLHPPVRLMTLSDSKDYLVAVHSDDSVRVSVRGRGLGSDGLVSRGEGLSFSDNFSKMRPTTHTGHSLETP